MAITWEELRSNLRSTVLQDTEESVDNPFKWSNAELLVYCGWALDTFADHTAAATATNFQVVASGVYVLPDNVYDDDPVDVTLTVFTELTDGTRDFLDPIRYSETVNLSNGQGYYVSQDKKLTVTKVLATNSVLNVWYYAYYNHPVADSDTIDIPRWAYSALTYLIAAHALSGDSLKSANIRQWGAKPDTGQPEQNPVGKQAKIFMQMYEAELVRHDPQLRVQHTRYTE